MNYSDGLREWRCPCCGATTRARMADDPAAVADLRAKAAGADRVRELHRPMPTDWPVLTVCSLCPDPDGGEEAAPWPCVTIAALNGDALDGDQP